MKTYRLSKSGDGTAICVVATKSGISRSGIYQLNPSKSQELANHSPDGFNFGYGGSGPAQLALAVLLDYFKDSEKALRHYQDFKWRFIAPAKDGTEITGQQIDDWMKS